MKFYDCRTAPSPQRTRILLAEKEIEVETVEVDLGQGEQWTEAFRQINPRCTVPVLELDDGTRLTENAGIAAYLEAVAPDPPMLGRSSEEKGRFALFVLLIATLAPWGGCCQPPRAPTASAQYQLPPLRSQP